MNKSRPVIIIGGGGHAAVLVDILMEQEVKIIAFVSPHSHSKRPELQNIKQLYQDDDVLAYSPEDVDLVNGIGVLPKSNLRFELYDFYTRNGYSFKSVISNSAIISSFAKIAKGAQVMHGSIIQSGATIGSHSIINTGAIIEHDCIIGEHNHIAPRAVICGGSITQNRVFIGAGATVIQSINIGELSMVAAGAVVNKNVLPHQCVYAARIEA